MAEMTALSTILNTQALTHSEIEDRRQKLYEEYLAKYPAVYISDWFLRNIRIEMRADKPCENCKGYPCKKNFGQGFQHFVTVEGEELYIRHKHCPYAKIANNTRRAQIPPMYADKTFADYKVDASNANAVKGAKTLQSLYIFGSPGTGKTFLAAIMGNEFLKMGKSVMFTDTPSLLDQIKSTFDRETEVTLENVMDKLAKVDVLILDDLGTETPTQWAVERLYLVINARYNAQKPLIVTSNYDLQQAAERMNKPKNGEIGVTGSRIASRIRGLCKVVQVGGADRRRP